MEKGACELPPLQARRCAMPAGQQTCASQQLKGVEPARQPSHGKENRAGSCAVPGPARASAAEASVQQSVRSLFTRPSQPLAPPLFLGDAQRSGPPAGLTDAWPAEQEHVADQALESVALSQRWGESWRAAQQPFDTADAGASRPARSAGDGAAFGAGEPLSLLSTQLGAAPGAAFCPTCGCFLFDLAGGAAARAVHVAACRAPEGTGADGYCSDGCRSDGGDEAAADEEPTPGHGASLCASAAGRKRPAQAGACGSADLDGRMPGPAVVVSAPQPDPLPCRGSARSAGSQSAGATAAWPAPDSSCAAAERRDQPAAQPEPPSRTASALQLHVPATRAAPQPPAAPGPDPSIRAWLRRLGLEALAAPFERAGLAPAALPLLNDQVRQTGLDVGRTCYLLAHPSVRLQLLLTWQSPHAAGAGVRCYTRMLKSRLGWCVRSGSSRLSLARALPGSC